MLPHGHLSVGFKTQLSSLHVKSLFLKYVLKISYITKFQIRRKPKMAVTESATQSEPIDAVRPIKVICIGVGMSSIICGVRFPQIIEKLELTIYEKNDDVGGVWYENR